MKLSFPKIVMILAALAIIGAGGWYVWSQHKPITQNSGTQKPIDVLASTISELARTDLSPDQVDAVLHTSLASHQDSGTYDEPITDSTLAGVFSSVSVEGSKTVRLTMKTNAAFTFAAIKAVFGGSDCADAGELGSDQIPWGTCLLMDGPPLTQFNFSSGALDSVLLEGDSVAVPNPVKTPPAISEAQAIENVKKFPRVATWLKLFTNPDGTAPGTGGRPVITLNSQTNLQYEFYVYEDMPDHTSTLGWFTVDKQTGEVLEETTQE